MSDSTSILDLPTDPVGGGNITLNASENVVQKYIQQPQQMGQQIMPQSGCFRGNGSLTSTVGRNEYFEPTANNAYSDNFQDYNLL